MYVSACNIASQRRCQEDRCVGNVLHVAHLALGYPVHHGLVLVRMILLQPLKVAQLHRSILEGDAGRLDASGHEGVDADTLRHQPASILLGQRRLSPLEGWVWACEDWMNSLEPRDGAEDYDGALALALRQVWDGSLEEGDETENVGLEAGLPILDGGFVGEGGS